MHAETVIKLNKDVLSLELEPVVDLQDVFAKG